MAHKRFNDHFGKFEVIARNDEGIDTEVQFLSWRFLVKQMEHPKQPGHYSVTIL